MTKDSNNPKFRGRTLALIVIGVAVAGFLALLAVRLITGHGLGISTFVLNKARYVSSVSRALLDSRSVLSYGRGEMTSVLFLHHSTGANLIQQGGVRERFAAAGYDFWDHGYNSHGLRRPDGSWTGYSYSIPGDNTDPDGLAGVFAQVARRLPVNALSGLLQHEVIAFKSCFPASQITSDAQLVRYKRYYLDMRDVMEAHPDKVFIVISPPPLNPAETDAEQAARARAFAEWLQSEEYLDDHPNVFTFDLHSALAESDPALPDFGMLRAAYREGTDSHPNRVANEAVGPIFVDFIIEAVQMYRATQGLG